MATQREYLIDLNLAKPTRGKFSGVAHEALAKARAEGVVFDDDNKVTVPRKVVASASSDASDHRRPREGAATQTFKPEPGGIYTKPAPQIRVRDIRTMYATDDEGNTIAFANCRKCAQHISFCKCSTIGLPSRCVTVLDRVDLLGV